MGLGTNLNGINHRDVTMSTRLWLEPQHVHQLRTTHANQRLGTAGLGVDAMVLSNCIVQVDGQEDTPKHCRHSTTKVQANLQPSAKHLQGMQQRRRAGSTPQQCMHAKMRSQELEHCMHNMPGPWLLRSVVSGGCQPCTAWLMANSNYAPK